MRCGRADGRYLDGTWPDWYHEDAERWARLDALLARASVLRGRCACARSAAPYRVVNSVLFFFMLLAIFSVLTFGK